MTLKLEVTPEQADFLICALLVLRKEFKAEEEKNKCLELIKYIRLVWSSVDETD